MGETGENACLVGGGCECQVGTVLARAAGAADRAAQEVPWGRPPFHVPPGDTCSVQLDWRETVPAQREFDLRQECQLPGILKGCRKMRRK